MGRTSDSRTAAANDNYRNNKFWEKKKNETLETENEPAERGNDCTPGNVGQSGELGRDGSGSGTNNSGDDV